MEGVGTKLTKYKVATLLAILFHGIGLIGILFISRNFFLRSTPVHLLLMLSLLIWTQEGQWSRSFLFFLFGSFLAGLSIEMIGVQTGIFFGHYRYGPAMGYQVFGTPLVLGVNWFIVIYCAGMVFDFLNTRFAGAIDLSAIPVRSWRNRFVIIAGGAVLAVSYDWLIEPVALKLDYWEWGQGGRVPLYNYLCWLVASLVLLSFFQGSKFEKGNKFAVNLLLIQVVFFLVLRIFLK